MIDLLKFLKVVFPKSCGISHISFKMLTDPKSTKTKRLENTALKRKTNFITHRATVIGVKYFCHYLAFGMSV